MSTRQSGDQQVNDVRAEFQEIATLIQRPLEGAGPCKLVWSRRKFKNLICEFEVAAKDGDGTAPATFVARTYKRGRGQENFFDLVTLWQAGFRPPSPCTVVQPIAYVPDRAVLLHERAPGRLLADIHRTELTIFQASEGASGKQLDSSRMLRKRLGQFALRRYRLGAGRRRISQAKRHGLGA